MKQLQCEMCGSTDLIKQEGMFVCQHCGCKYSVEEAKKMMIEGTVDVQGTVKIDDSDNIEKHLTNARGAKERKDWEGTEKYYNLVLQNDPNCIEAVFSIAYAKAMSTFAVNDIYQREAAFNVLVNSVSIISNMFTLERGEENKKAIYGITTDLEKMICSGFVYTEWKNQYGMVYKTDKDKTYTLFSNVLNAYRQTIYKIAKIDNQPYVYEAAIKLYTTAQSTKIGNWKKVMKEWITIDSAELDKCRNERISAYWAEHQEEHQQLESEKTTLQDDINALQSQVDALPESAEVSSIEKQITELNNEKNSLGLLKIKEKKAIQDKINALNVTLTNAKNRKAEASKSIDNRMMPLKNRLNEVCTELTKDR